MKAYHTMNADQLRAQVEVLLDSVSSWEEKVGGYGSQSVSQSQYRAMRIGLQCWLLAQVRSLVEEKTNIAVQVETQKLQTRRREQKISDLVDKVQLQQAELEVREEIRYIMLK